ncbi:MAG: hypothetical protein LBS57_08060 [Treponema sp.]|jgi:hypothetical protein|nr:hypothetical protein [Treponema sp.]
MDTTVYTEYQRGQFVSGWEDAGGYTGDLDTPTPWCCPWLHADTTIPMPEGSSPREAGRLWWESCREEVEELLAQEQEIQEAENAVLFILD